MIPVESGSQTLKDAVNEALRDWVTNVRTTYYLLGSALGPHPYPMMVRDFHARDRRGGARASPAARPAGCPTCWWPAWAAAPTRSGSSGPSSGTARVRIVGRRARRPRHRDRQARRLARRRRGRRAAREHELRAPERRRPDRGGALDLGRPRLSRASGPEHAYYKDAGRFEYASVTDAGGARGLPGPHAARGHHARARVRARGGLRDAGRPRAMKKTQSVRGRALGPRRQGRAHGGPGPRRRGRNGHGGHR